MSFSLAATCEGRFFLAYMFLISVNFFWQHSEGPYVVCLLWVHCFFYRQLAMHSLLQFLFLWLLFAYTTVNYHCPYHWLRENYEFKTTFGTNRIRGIESAIASTITWERRQPNTSRTKDICFVSPWPLGFTVDVGKRCTWVIFYCFLMFVINFL